MTEILFIHSSFMQQQLMYFMNKMCLSGDSVAVNDKSYTLLCIITKNTSSLYLLACVHRILFVFLLLNKIMH